MGKPSKELQAALNTLRDVSIDSNSTVEQRKKALEAVTAFDRIARPYYAITINNKNDRRTLVRFLRRRNILSQVRRDNLVVVLRPTRSTEESIEKLVGELVVGPQGDWLDLLP